jgi:hypothetical protein
MKRALERIVPGCLLAAAASCQKTPSVTFEVVMSPDVSNAAQWVEVGVFPGNCPTANDLLGGLPVSGMIARVAFEKGNLTPPPIGDLKKGSYGFAAVARDPNCAVLATGCSVVDVSSARDVSITVAATSQGGGACPAAESCLDARCVPSLENGDASLGANCSLRIIGGGPLGDPLDLSGSDVTSGPAIAPTETGFIVAYREYDQLSGAARLTVATIDAGGGLTVPTPTTLPGQCPAQDESDGVGLGYAQGFGLVVSTRPQCQQPNPGFDTFQIDAMGNVQKSSFTSVSGVKPVLSIAHALAVPDPSTAWLAYIENNAAGIASVVGLDEKNPIAFGGPAPHTESMVADSGKMVALLAVGTGVATNDAGMPTEGGGAGSTARLTLGMSPSTAAQVVPPFPATWASLAVDGTRAFVVSDSSSANQQVAWIAADLGGTMPAASGTFAPPFMGPVFGGDVAAAGDTLAFAVEQKDAISVIGFTHASTTPTQANAVSLTADAHLPSMKTVRDGRLAVASNGSLVAVVWMTAKTIGANDPLGGYAVLACSK